MVVDSESVDQQQKQNAVHTVWVRTAQGGKPKAYFTSFQNAAFRRHASTEKMPRKINTPTPKR